MTARTYRKRPVEVEAIQFTGWPSAEEIQTFAPGTVFVPAGYEHRMRYNHEKDRSNGNVYEDIAPAFLVIHTLEGDHRANIGDFIIRGVQGEFYPCKPDIFAQTYEPVVS
jgi:hypothetical protein